uniref:Uncharacterized protein n=1 Tax=viral metagenome TaxID=1070528 RepID=A0A6M3LBE9_9ZZZZ
MTQPQPQPQPQPGRENVTPVAREDFNRRLTEREQQGLATYGTTLQTFNGRDAIKDALDELIDAYQYVIQAQMERDSDSALDRKLGQALRTLWDAVHWPEYKGFTIELRIPVGETTPVVRIWHHQSNTCTQWSELDTALQRAAEHATQWAEDHPQQVLEPSRGRQKAKGGAV